MSDKKNEDFTIRMPESGSRSPYGNEKDSFIPPRPSRVASQSHNSLAARFARAENSPPASILAYCIASISMTVVNKYVVSGSEWNLNFFYLAVQVHGALALPPTEAGVLTMKREVDSLYRDNPGAQITRLHNQLVSVRHEQGPAVYVHSYHSIVFCKPLTFLQGSRSPSSSSA